MSHVMRFSLSLSCTRVLSPFQFPLAIYSLSLVLAKKAAFWDPTVIPEDWHMYFRCQFAEQGQVI